MPDMKWSTREHMTRTCLEDLTNYDDPETLFTPQELAMCELGQREWWDTYGQHLTIGEKVKVLPYGARIADANIVGHEVTINHLDYDDSTLPICVNTANEGVMWVFRVAPLVIIEVPRITSVAEADEFFEQLQVATHQARSEP